MPPSDLTYCVHDLKNMVGLWQRRRDSNPRNALTFTPLAGERLRPLGHVSADPSSWVWQWEQDDF